jgi:hypothetical protein
MQDIIALFIVGIALVIALFYFLRKIKRIKNNEQTCSGCSTNSCDGCAIQKINQAKNKK